MRYDTPVYFQRITPGQYDENTGNYGIDYIDETKMYASVTDSSTETMKLIYGSIKQGSLTIRLQNHYMDAYDRIRIGSKVYETDLERKTRGHSFVVHEVQ